MKLSQPIPIDLKAFVLHGRFDFLELGQDRGWVQNNFPDPDMFGPKGPMMSAGIWRYGNLELHFGSDNRLQMIWTDYVGSIDGGPSLDVALWRLNDRLSLGQWIQLLASESVSFTLQSRERFSRVELLVPGGAALGFPLQREDVLGAVLGSVCLK